MWIILDISLTVFAPAGGLKFLRNGRSAASIASHLVPNMESIVAKAVAETKEEERNPSI